jgi:hypothetical protein
VSHLVPGLTAWIKGKKEESVQCKYQTHAMPNGPNVVVICCDYYIIIIEGSLEVKLPTIWTDEKQRW